MATLLFRSGFRRRAQRSFGFLTFKRAADGLLSSCGGSLQKHQAATL
jgi:hypothetical protein